MIEHSIQNITRIYTNRCLKYTVCTETDLFVDDECGFRAVFSFNLSAILAFVHGVMKICRDFSRRNFPTVKVHIIIINSKSL